MFKFLASIKRNKTREPKALCGARARRGCIFRQETALAPLCHVDSKRTAVAAVEMAMQPGVNPDLPTFNAVQCTAISFDERKSRPIAATPDA